MSRKSRSRTSIRSTFGSFLLGCVTGVALGAVLGVLTAPQRGRDTRGKLARKAEEMRDQFRDTVTREKDGDAVDEPTNTQLQSG